MKTDPGRASLARLQQAAQLKTRSRIAELVNAEPDRQQRFCIEAAGLYCDFSRTDCSRTELDALLEHARTIGLAARRDRMLSGARVNLTENRAVLHTALRRPKGDPVLVDGADVMPEVHRTLDRISEFSLRVREGQWRGASGQTITDVVNIGIGGSQLGPDLACQALTGTDSPVRVHFLASLDPQSWNRIAARLDPARTLAIVASKSWKTLETALGALAVRDWFLGNGIEQAALRQHIVAVSTNVAAASEFGVDPANVFPFWDWVGGRYSLWSAIGLPVMLAIGPEQFRRMLAGAHALDQHFAQAPLERNLPIIHGLLAWWQTLVTGSRSEAILPYSHGLARLPAYLQQLSMESNGKSVDLEGRAVPVATAPVTWGEPGTESQHSFFQLLHQGTDAIPAEFVLPMPVRDPVHGRDLALVANCLAQADALMRGRTLDEVKAELRAQGRSQAEVDARAPHMVYPGNRPTSIIQMDRLDAAHFGALIALYEHRTAVQGLLWNINSFDQWGVEFGKQRATSIQPLLENPDEAVLDGLDPAARALYRRIRGALQRR